MTQQVDPQGIASLAARLLYLTQQEKAISAEKDQVKAALEELYESDLMPAKPDDFETLFSDGSTRNIRLQRVSTGTYFKVADDHEKDYKAKTDKLKADFLKAGKAEMANKACTWKVQEVK